MGHQILAITSFRFVQATEKVVFMDNSSSRLGMDHFSKGR